MGEAREVHPWAVNKTFFGLGATQWLRHYYRVIMASFEFYLHNINLIVSLECAIHVVIT